MRREQHALSTAVEEISADQLLQALDLGADRRLRHPERIRSLGKAAQVNNSDQSPQEIGRNICHAINRPQEFAYK
jgi:hypothetical protein